jgi:hypothetical protein
VEGLNPFSSGLRGHEVVKARDPRHAMIGMNCSGRPIFCSSVLNTVSVSGNMGQPVGSSKSQTPYLASAVSDCQNSRDLNTYRSRKPPENTLRLAFGSSSCSGDWSAFCKFPIKTP